jgi:hypothetical protein
MFGAAGVGAAAASATPGAGTFTKITTPKTMTYKFDGAHPTANTFVVSGVTSTDVTSVDIDCIWISPTSGPVVSTFASAVPVTSGSFSTTALFPDFTTNCRLRAIPAGADVTDYLGSYSGPILYANTLVPTSTSGVTYGYTAIGEEGNGIAAVIDAGTCGVALVATIQTPSMALIGNPSEDCAFALPPENIVTSGTASTGSAITVDGHDAYLPGGVNSFLNGSLSLGLTQPKLTTTFTRAKNGDLTVTESAPLMRCSVSDTFPPTSTSCPQLVSTGVTFKRSANLFRGDHQVRLRDTFTSTGAAHSVRLQYAAGVPKPATGSAGLAFPGHGSTFVGADAGEIVTGLGKKAASVLVRSDRYAATDETEADTQALTWSAAPSKFQFANPADSFGMSYSLSVPTHGTAFLGFADSENPSTAGVAKLAALAVGDMTSAPTISSPKNHASIKRKSTVVKGSVTASANGLPKSVSVNGHKAKLTVSSATKATWTVTFSEPFGRHTITATATDAAGNTSRSSIKVTNKH